MAGGEASLLPEGIPQTTATNDARWFHRVNCRCFRVRTSWRHALCPFLKLRHRADEPFLKCCRHRQASVGEVFLVGGGLWIFAVFMFCYVLLAISSTTFELEWVPNSKPTTFRSKSKTPAVGTHYTVFLLAKHVVEVLLLNHLCGNLMEPLEETRNLHVTDLDIMQPHGMIQGFRKVISRLMRYEYRPRWISTFQADHILLMVVGICSLVNTVVMCYIKVCMQDEQQLEHFFVVRVDIGSSIQLLLNAAMELYVSVLVIGFLLTTLEDCVVPKADRRGEFHASMALLIVCWGTTFLAVLFDRQVYHSSFISSTVFQRILAAAAQVFATHSSVMLGAVALGHSGHFKRCPDLTWRSCIRAILPLALCISAIVLWLAMRRHVHGHGSCNTLLYNYFARTWPYFSVIFRTVGGGWLLWLSIMQDNGRSTGHAIDSLDYDTTLILATFAVAVVWNVAQVFDMEAQHILLSTLSEVLVLLAPLGLASFALGAWRSPPPLGSARSRSLWFALLFAAALFFQFQDKEDCEISSSSPYCCDFPGFPDYNAKEERNLRCNKDLRCTRSQNVTWLDDPLYCALSEEDSYAELLIFDAATCDTLSQRWDNYVAMDESGYSFSMQEALQEQEKESSAFRLFKAVGQAASCEMFFTIFGVLLKVFFMTQHPNSEAILALDAHQHHHGNAAAAHHGHALDGAAAGAPGAELHSREGRSPVLGQD